MARADRRRPRLDQPKVPGRSVLPTPDPEAFGRFSERIARFIGTGRFLVIQTVVIFVWVVWNVAVPKTCVSTTTRSSSSPSCCRCRPPTPRR